MNVGRRCSSTCNSGIYIEAVTAVTVMRPGDSDGSWNGQPYTNIVKPGTVLNNIKKLECQFIYLLLFHILTTQSIIMKFFTHVGRGTKQGVEYFLLFK